MNNKLYYIVITDDSKTGGRNLQAIMQLQTAKSYDEAVDTAMMMFRDHPLHNLYNFGEEWYSRIKKEIRNTGWVIIQRNGEYDLSLSILKLGR